MLDAALEYFLSLPASDRRAVEQQLDPEARQALLSRLEERRLKQIVARTPLPDTKPYSRWLKRHLDKVLAENPTSTVTPAAREALQALLCEPAP